MYLSAFVDKIEDLPSLPSVANQINIETQTESLTAVGLSKIVSQDPSLASKVLKLANSAYYGLAKKVTTIDRAITLLGFNTIRKLALSLSVFKIFTDQKELEIDMEGLWQHSLGCASAAKTLAKITNPGFEEEAFLCGLIHDIGIIAMLSTFPEEMKTTIRMMKEAKLVQNEAEKRIFGFTHQEAGAVLSDRWNFPDKYAKAIRFHHNPFVDSVEPDDPDSLLIFTVYAGNQIVKTLFIGQSFDYRITGVDSRTWAMMGTAPNELLGLKSKIKEDYENTIKSWGL